MYIHIYVLSQIRVFFILLGIIFPEMHTPTQDWVNQMPFMYLASYNNLYYASYTLRLAGSWLLTYSIFDSWSWTLAKNHPVNTNFFYRSDGALVTRRARFRHVFFIGKFYIGALFYALPKAFTFSMDIHVDPDNRVADFYTTPSPINQRLERLYANCFPMIYGMEGTRKEDESRFYEIIAFIADLVLLTGVPLALNTYLISGIIKAYKKQVQFHGDDFRLISTRGKSSFPRRKAVSAMK